MSPRPLHRKRWRLNNREKVSARKLWLFKKQAPRLGVIVQAALPILPGAPAGDGDTDADPEAVVRSDSNVTAMPTMLLQTKAK